MSIVKAAAFNNPAASTGGLAIGADGNVTGAGLDLITAQSFTAASSVSINNCFSSTYDNYRILYDQIAVASSPIYLRFRMRASGADNSSSVYGYAYNEGYSGGSAGGSASGQSFGIAGFVGSANDAAYSMEVYRPALASFTKILSTGVRYNGSYSTIDFGNRHESAAAYDGISFFTDAGTITGTIRVYGYRN